MGSTIPIRLISATYGPCPGRRLFNGEITGGSGDATYTRDVLPHLTKLVGEACEDEERPSDSSDLDGDVGASKSSKKRKRVPAHRRRRRRVAFPLMDGVSMNVAFGDPCCGTTKMLTIKFEFTDESTRSISTATFREHERVVLRRSNVIQESKSAKDYKSASKNPSTLAIDESTRLQTETSEVILPLLLPYLEVRRRAKCQLVCKCWRSIIGDVGVATTVDVNDPSFKDCSRKFLRGIIAHSYSSLCSLILNDVADLAKEDLHPTLPNLTKLRALDISRCNRLDNSTLMLLSKHLGDRLEVLYMKGLVKITDVGMVAVCKACRLLRVLEISNLSQITDRSGIAVGENLSMLEALYMRENYQLTNESVDCITSRCKKLSLLTLWGCIRLKNLTIDRSEGDVDELNQLVMLNLWGCHGLGDDVASEIRKMPHLRSLIISECHNLTDQFITDLTQPPNVSRIEHLNLRYLRRLTDGCLPAIASNMSHLQSVDLSFCTQLSTSSLAYLLESAPSLTELRLWNCHQIDVTIPRAESSLDDGADGRALCNAIKSRSAQKSKFVLLDIRRCIGRHRHHNNVRQDDAIFLQGMSDIGFEQKVELFFTRPSIIVV